MKEKIKKFMVENWFKLSFAIAVILIGIAFFYYFVIFLPQKEQARINQQNQEQLAKEQKEQKEKEEATKSLNFCLSFAEDNYSSMWNKECDYLGELTTECKDILLNTYSYNNYVSKKNLSIEPSDKNYLSVIDYYKKKEECSCRLPTTRADRLNESLKEDKAECYKKYPQN